MAAKNELGTLFLSEWTAVFFLKTALFRQPPRLASGYVQAKREPTPLLKISGWQLGYGSLAFPRALLPGFESVINNLKPSEVCSSFSL